MSVALDLAPSTEAEVADIVADCHARRAPLRIAGGGTRVENRASGETLSLSRLSGVVTYSPGEMTLIARPGTPLPEIQQMLAAVHQSLGSQKKEESLLNPFGAGFDVGESCPSCSCNMGACNSCHQPTIRFGACYNYVFQPSTTYTVVSSSTDVKSSVV